jgi:hypothetical protein
VSGRTSGGGTAHPLRPRHQHPLVSNASQRQQFNGWLAVNCLAGTVSGWQPLY